MDVLDDFVGEAKEVYNNNKWITYGKKVVSSIRIKISGAYLLWIVFIL